MLRNRAVARQFGHSGQEWKWRPNPEKNNFINSLYSRSENFLNLFFMLFDKGRIFIISNPAGFDIGINIPKVAP